MITVILLVASFITGFVSCYIYMTTGVDQGE